MGHIAGFTVLLAFVGLELGVTGHGITAPSTVSTWAGLAFFGALQGGVYLFVYAGFGKGQVSVLNPVFASFSGFVALVSILFLGEGITVMGVIALGILFAGILLINLDLGALRERRLRITLRHQNMHQLGSEIRHAIPRLPQGGPRKPFAT